MTINNLDNVGHQELKSTHRDKYNGKILERCDIEKHIDFPFQGTR